MITMTLTNPEWTIATMTAEWINESGETPAVAEDAANWIAAWLINNTSRNLNGWSYTDGQFTGPARVDAIEKIGGLIVEAGDQVIEHLDEIRAEHT